MSLKIVQNRFSGLSSLPQHQCRDIGLQCQDIAICSVAGFVFQIVGDITSSFQLGFGRVWCLLEISLNVECNHE